MQKQKPKSQKNEAIRLAQTELSRRHLKYFTQFTHGQYDMNWHHEVMFDKLQEFLFGDLDRLMIFMPPRNGKSEAVSRRLPAYILGHNPDLKIISASYSSDLASRMNRDVQRIIDNPFYHEIFPGTALNNSNVRTIANGSYLRNSDIFEVVGHEGVYKSSGVGGAITGMGMDIGIIDDPFKNRQDASSARIRENVWDWYVSTFYTRLEKGGKILITLTRWHEDDLAGRLLALAEEDENADQWEVINFPAIAEGKLHPSDQREEGEALWPWKYPLKELHKIRATIGSYEFNALYQQRPSPSGGAIFKKHWINYYDVMPPLYEFDQILQSWDLTFKGTDGSDYVAGGVWGVIGADSYLLDVEHARMSFPETIEAFERLTARWPEAIVKLVEDKANGPAIISMLQKKIPGLIPVEPYGSKEARAHAVAPVFESGNVWLPRKAKFTKTVETELLQFPNAANDDLVDMTTQALDRIYNGYQPMYQLR